mgnify:CR=1 FL=1
MKSIESKIQNEYKKMFSQNDWKIFKVGANFYLKNAAFLKKNDIKGDKNVFQFPIKNSKKNKQLLFRNIQKRLSIGIGCELLIKSYYLKSGFYINKPIDIKKNRGAAFLFSELIEDDINSTLTFTFKMLIDGLSKLERKLQGVSVKRIKEIDNALIIARVFRNKEAHSITNTHIYNESDYKKIETGVVEMYSIWFGEELDYKISFEKGEDKKFEIKR